MASTNFKLFDENKVNMMSDTEYNIAAQRLNGVQTGIASSQLQNKTLYQTSLMSYALAQLMNANGIDSNDTAAVSAFVNGLSDTLVQKVLDKATEQMAIAGIDNSHYMTPALVKKEVENMDPLGPWIHIAHVTENSPCMSGAVPFDNSYPVINRSFGDSIRQMLFVVNSANLKKSANSGCYIGVSFQLQFGESQGNWDGGNFSVYADSQAVEDTLIEHRSLQLNSIGDHTFDGKIYHYYGYQFFDSKNVTSVSLIPNNKRQGDPSWKFQVSSVEGSTLDMDIYLR